VITCVVEYTIDPAKIEPFEHFGRAWIDLVNRHGGQHRGHFLPSEGASDRALALFSFRRWPRMRTTAHCSALIPTSAAVDRIRDQSGCVLKYERSFMRPVLGPDPES